MEKKYKYRFTIFTSCFNSEKFIHRVYESLRDQTFRDFEWLVIDDASLDNTCDLIEDYVKKANFDINFIQLAENQMLTKNINLAVEVTQGELFVLAGHDDRIMPNALEEFDRIWKIYGNTNLSGIFCLCQDQNGNLVGNRFPEDLMISDYFTISYKLKYDREKFGFTRTEVLREFPFDSTVAKYIPEGVLWANIGLKYQSIWINKILRIYYIEPHNTTALTKSNRRTFADGICYSYLMWINKFEQNIKGRHIFKLRNKFAYAFYGILSGGKFPEMLPRIKKGRKKVQFIMLYPLALLMYRLFIILKKV